MELVDKVTSAKSKAGDVFRGRLEDGVWIRGRVAVPPGTTVRGVVVEAAPSGRVQGRAKLALTLRSLELEGISYAVRTDTLSYTGGGHAGQHVGSALMGALQGALYGVLFGGKSGAIIGAGAGAGAGTASSVWSGKNDVEFLQGAKLLFELQRAVAVPEAPAAPAPRAREKPAAKTPEKADESGKAGKPAG